MDLHFSPEHTLWLVICYEDFSYKISTQSPVKMITESQVIGKAGKVTFKITKINFSLCMCVLYKQMAHTCRSQKNTSDSSVILCLIPLRQGLSPN